MKIGIDISQVAYEGTGVARYTANLIKAVCEYDKTNQYTFFFSSLRRSIPNNLKNLIQKKHRLVTVKLPPTVLDVLWNRLHILPIETFIGNQDIFISSDWTQPPSRAKKVTIVHDLMYLRYPETLHQTIIDVQKRRMEHVKKEVEIIITNSETTKQDLVDLLSIPTSKIYSIYPAVDITLSSQDDLQRIHTKYSILNTKYLLSVGKLEPRKNIPRLIEAFIKADLKDVDLLIAGPKGWSTNEFQISNFKFQIPESIKFLGYVSDPELYALYSKALFFIYPSLYEGFGYPVIEAMSMGCPVATSNTSSLKEIAQGSALLFDPTSVDEIKDTILKLVNDEKLRSSFVEKGKKKAAEFTLKHFFEGFKSTLRAV